MEMEPSRDLKPPITRDWRGRGLVWQGRSFHSGPKLFMVCLLLLFCSAIKFSFSFDSTSFRRTIGHGQIHAISGNYLKHRQPTARWKKGQCEPSPHRIRSLSWEVHSSGFDDSFASVCNDKEHFAYTDISNVDRVFCLSDLHTDHTANLKWLKGRVQTGPSTDAPEDNIEPLNERDLVVVAGDISHHIDTFVETLRTLRSKCQVFFVPGNHEAWLPSNDPSKDSLDKLDRLKRLCYEEGVYTDPIRIRVPFNATTRSLTTCNSSATPISLRSLWIIPLQCWYDGTLSFSEELCHDFGKWPWVDFQQCNWPVDQFPPGLKGEESYRIPQGLVDYFLEQNRQQWNDIQSAMSPSESPLNGQDDDESMVMTVSHFLPNKQCLPDWKDLDATEFDLESWLDHGGGGTSAKFAKVAGSRLLDEQLRTISAQLRGLRKKETGANDAQSFGDEGNFKDDVDYRHMHVFGHSHRPKDFCWNGVRYIHNPLGKPRERNLYMISPNVDFQLLWTAHEGPVPGETILRYWDEKGGGKEALWRRLESLRPSYSKREQRMERQSAHQDQKA